MACDRRLWPVFGRNESFTNGLIFSARLTKPVLCNAAGDYSYLRHPVRINPM